MNESLRQRTIESFLSELASPKPTPGGGAAAALTLAQAAALLTMVCRISNKADDRLLSETARKASEGIDRGLINADRDAIAFEKLMKALKMPKTCPAEQESRRRDVEVASIAAAQIPLDTIVTAHSVLQSTDAVCPLVSQHLLSDVGVITALIQAAAAACRLTVLINLRSIKGLEHATEMRQQLDTVTEEIRQLAAKLQAHVETALAG